MTNSKCLNCDTVLAPDQKFCLQCGQKINIHRLTIAHIIHKFFHAITHADKGILTLIANLAVRPGRVALEYIGGKRKKYFNPFTFFLICIGLFVLANNVFKPFGKIQGPDPRIVQQLPPEKRQKYINITTWSAQANKFVQKNANIVTMIALPLYALLTWMFFKKRGHNYAEHLVANILFVSFGNLLFTFLFSPFMGMTVGTPWFIYLFLIGMFLQLLYFSWVHFQFLRFKNPFSYVLTFSVCLLIFLLWTLRATITIFMYIFRSDFLKVVKDNSKTNLKICPAIGGMKI